jgi:hypothetical protein
MDTLHIKFEPLIVIHSDRHELPLAHIERLLHAMEHRIMSKISEFAQRQAEFYRAQSEAVEGIVSSVAGLSGDLTSLKDQIAALQASPGVFTPEDQAAMDKLEADTGALTERLTSVSTELQKLDAMTPPVAG